MDKSMLAASCRLTERQVKARLAPWYNRAGDYILIPHEDRAAARARLYRLGGPLAPTGKVERPLAGKTGQPPAGKVERPPTGKVEQPPADQLGKTPGTPGRILAIAHIDTVLGEGWVFDAGDGIVYSPALDDRLGVYTFFWEFDGVECDILLTDHEEIGQSTAQWFEVGREYNWLVQFDRHGTDVVMYQYDTRENRDRLIGAGAQPGLGTFSDIAYLDWLGVAGFNWGTGYHLEHSRNCHVVVAEYEAMLGQFLAFYTRWGGERIEHKGEVDEGLVEGGYDYWSELECGLCGMPVPDHDLRWVGELQLWVCRDCAEENERGGQWGECIGCGQWGELEVVHSLGERLCKKCRMWWGEP